MSLLIYSPNSEKYDAWQEAFAAVAPSLPLEFGDHWTSEDVKYALVWQPPLGMLASLPNLRAIFSMGAGIDHITRDPELPQLPLVRQRDAGMGEQMAEYALYAALHYQRDFDRMRLQQSQKRWDASVSGVKPKLKVGVLGMGTLGSKVALALLNNGFGVSGWSRSIKQIEGVASYSGESGLADFLAGTELLICLLPDTPKTRGIVDKVLLQQLPKGAAVVNLARGALVVDQDLLAALDTGQIRGAMLDVFHREPLPQEHPYWQHPKVVITPHIAAETVFHASAQQVAADIQRLEQGLAPVESVDLQRGY
ncbi:MAG: 2-hydroxyacid dehydrogenase [Granulosicoccaceae bacterium]